MSYFLVKHGRGRSALSDGAKLYRGAGFDAQLAFDANDLKSGETMKKYRTGYRFAWSRCSTYMKQCGLQKPGTYDPKNQHGGQMFALPRDLSLSNVQAGNIMRKCYKLKGGGTRSQLDGVRKMLAYAFQLTTGNDCSHKRDDPTNYRNVNRAWRNMKPQKIKAPTQKILAEVYPQPINLKTCFTTEYEPGKGPLNFHEWCVGGLATWDSSVCGARSVTDLKKIKDSRKHKVVASAGYMWTQMKGGRSKLEYRKKGIRPWKNYRVCLCPGGVHKPVPKDWIDNTDSAMNPLKPTWCTTCPLNQFQVIQEGTPSSDNRTYVRWAHTLRRFSRDSYSEDALKVLINTWITQQGGNPDDLKFDSNGGRKSLAAMCSEYKIPYHKSFEQTGDLWQTWKTYYQTDLKKDPCFTRRTQSPNPEVASAALRMIARGFGRGRTVRDDPPDMQRMEKLLAVIGRKIGLSAEVAMILRTEPEPFTPPE